MLNIAKILLTLTLATQPLLSLADAKKQAGIESLSPALRQLLNKEMIAIQEGMMTIIPAYAAGDTAQIARTAKAIKNSYVLKQQLSDEQKHELHSKLPASFIQRDEKFHYYAGMLEHVAEKNKHELIGFYFSKLAESCADCHRAYAKHKFPNFEQSKAAPLHAH